MSCLPAELRRALLAQTCCGIDELCEFLECELDLLWDSQDGCTFRLQYLYTQLGLIEAAQIFARNKIDTMTREASSQMQEKYTALSNILSNAERDASGRSCSWAASTSSQHFNRDSDDQAIGWTDYRHKYISDFRNDGYDRSCRHTTGYGFHKSNIASRHQRVLDELGRSNSEQISSTKGGTDPYLPIFNLKYDGLPIFTPYPPFVSNDLPPDPTDFAIVPPLTDAMICPPFDPVIYPDDVLLPNPVCVPKDGYYPSAGSGLNGNFQVSVTTPPIGSVSVSWTNAKNQRQFYTCVNATSTEISSRFHGLTDNSTTNTDAAERDNQNGSFEDTQIQHLVRKYGITVRRSVTNNDGEEKAEGIAKGIASSHSDRKSQGIAYNQSRAEAESVRHAESHYRKTERANSDMVSAKYGQVSKHLKALWERLWEYNLMLEKQLSAKPYGGKMNCPKEAKSCLPVRRSWHDLNRVTLHV